MNPELLLSFAIMQGLAPAGTTVPVEAVLTSADAMPAWARFTFQVHLFQRMQEDLTACRAKVADLQKHHHQTHETLDALKDEVRTLLRTLHEKFDGKAKYQGLIQELRDRPDLASVTALYKVAVAEPHPGGPDHHPDGNG